MNTDHDLGPTGPLATVRVDGNGMVLDAGDAITGGPRMADGRHGAAAWVGASLADHAAPSQQGDLAAWFAAATSATPPSSPFLWRARRDDGQPLLVWLHTVGRGVLAVQRAGGPAVPHGEPLPAVPPRLGADHVLNHDVRAGLRAARSFLGVHTRRSPDAPEELATVARSLATTDQLVDGLVRFHRIGTDPIAVERVALADVVVQAGRQAEDTLSDLASSPAWAELGGGFVVHGPGRSEVAPDLIGDGSLLEWLFGELCINARKFAGPTVVSVSATVTGSWMTVRVGNTGAPIDADLGEEAFLLGRLLQPRHERPGVGIGLPMCRRIATRHAGSLRFVDPKRVEGESGTVLELELPIAGDRPAPTERQRGSDLDAPIDR